MSSLQSITGFNPDSDLVIHYPINKNLAIANRSRVRCAHTTLRAFIGLNITA